MFRVCGTDLDIDALLAETSLVPEMSHRRDEPKLKGKPRGRKNERSGASFLVNLADFDHFETQKNGALVFLKVNRAAVQKIMAWPGVDSGCFDFGIWRREVPVQCDSFPAGLLKAAGNLGLDVELSQYPNEKEGEPTTPCTPIK
jgi:hypothetical protein